MREARNYQFDFLRPTHSLFSYFNQMVEQYSRVLHPPPEIMEKLALINGEGGRWKFLEVARERGEWERHQREKEERRVKEKDEEAIGFAEIDWHDFAIVQTIEFTQADAQSELPPPMSIAEVEKMTLAQKRMAAMISENTAPEVEAHKASLAAAEAAAKLAEEDVEMDVDSDDEADAKKNEEEELARIKQLQAKSTEHGPMKIRKDYVPKCASACDFARLVIC